MDIGEKIKIWRDKKKISQTALDALIGQKNNGLISKD